MVLWEERLKNFRSIRRGFGEVVREIEQGSRVRDLQVRYLPYSELERHREAIARFGQGMKPIEALARTLV